MPCRATNAKTTAQTVPLAEGAMCSSSATCREARPCASTKTSATLPYPVVGWYGMRHVQQVIGARFHDIAPLNTIAGMQCPVLLVHERQDAVVPAGDAVRLVARSGRARLLQLEGDHDLREALAPHAAAVVAFLHAVSAERNPAVNATRLQTAYPESMLSISLGPIAPPVAPLLLLLAVCIACWVATKLSTRQHPDAENPQATDAAGNAVFVAAGFGLLVAWLAHLASHAQAGARGAAGPWLTARSGRRLEGFAHHAVLRCERVTRRCALRRAQSSRPRNTPAGLASDPLTSDLI